MAKIFKIAAAFLFLSALPAAAEAATLYISPSSGSYAVGAAFSASVYVSSADQAMNAASGGISFPKDKLEVTSISKAGSIFSLWVQEPAFSNSTGFINFEGIVLNPGFRGSGGKILTISFKAKSAGQASLYFSSGSCLANDGAGTNILTGMGSANYQLSAASVSPETPTEQTPEKNRPPPPGVPAAPKVFSSTHPDSNKWYNNKNPRFSWTLPAGVTGVSFYFSQSPTSNPGPVSDGLFASKSYEKVEDGVWYFHIKMKNSAGWGPITHFRIQVDTQPPEPFAIKFFHGKETTDVSPIIIFNTIDALSGIDHYQIRVGENGPFSAGPGSATSNPYTLPPQEPGKRTVSVQAYDKAGNSTTETEEFEILPLEPPKITRCPEKIMEGDSLEMGGKTYPDSDVDLFVGQKDEKITEQRVRSDSSGDFAFIWSQKLESGAYSVQAQVTDNRGAKSLKSQPINISVEPAAVRQVSPSGIDYLFVAALILLLLLILMFGVWYGRHRHSCLGKRIREEARKTESALYKRFNVLKKIRKQIKALEKTRMKRQFTEEEEKIIKKLKKDLDDAEKVIRKGIENVEKAVKR